MGAGVLPINKDPAGRLFQIDVASQITAAQPSAEAVRITTAAAPGGNRWS
jgi:hypothetical protein